MLYQESHQRLRVCRTLLTLMGYEHLWTSEGPTVEAKRILDQYGGTMSNAQWVLYQVVWYVWGRPADVKLQEVMQLPQPYAELATDLLHAELDGPAAVEAWLGRVEAIQSRPRKLHQLA